MAGYAHISTNVTNQQIQKGTTTLQKVVVNNTGSSWVITIMNGSSGDTVAAITASNGGNYDFECTCPQGIYVTTSGTTAGDCTIIFD